MFTAKQRDIIKFALDYLAANMDEVAEAFVENLTERNHFTEVQDFGPRVNALQEEIGEINSQLHKPLHPVLQGLLDLGPIIHPDTQLIVRNGENSREEPSYGLLTGEILVGTFIDESEDKQILLKWRE